MLPLMHVSPQWSYYNVFQISVLHAACPFYTYCLNDSFTWKIIIATTDLFFCRYASVHSTDTIFNVVQNKRAIIQYWYTSKKVVSFKPLHENQLTGLTCSLLTQFITRKWYIEILIVVLWVVTVCNLVGHNYFHIHGQVIAVMMWRRFCAPLWFWVATILVTLSV